MYGILSTKATETRMGKVEVKKEWNCIVTQYFSTENGQRTFIKAYMKTTGDWEC